MTTDTKTAGQRSAATAERRRIVFIAEQFFPPVNDGSTYVNRNWIDFLAERYELYAVLFSTFAGDTTAAERYLDERCRAHLILPGTPTSAAWKVARAASRLPSGTIFAPRWIEEFGRSEVHRTVGAFLARHQPEIVLVNKIISVPLVGECNLADRRRLYLLEMHDDFVERDRIDREVLARLLRRHPALRSYRRFRDMRLRQLMSRLAERRARAQERRLLELFDCVLPRSQIEYARYRSLLNGAPPCRMLGWPPPPRVSADAVACGVTPRFDAGFIAGDYPYNVEAVLDFCSAILPLIRRQRPDFTLLVAGRVAEPLALLARDWPGVEFAGYLPDSAAFYGSVRLVVVPLLSGTGISVKTIEALQHGKPVVSTTVGARGVDRNRADGLLEIADAPEDFAERVSSFLSKHRGSPRPAVPLSPVERDPNDAFAASFGDLLAEVATAPHPRIAARRRSWQSGRQDPA